MKGTLYLIPCPISSESAPFDIMPEANRAIIDSLDLFFVENIRSARRFLAKVGLSRPIDTLEFFEVSEHSSAGLEIDKMVKKVAEGRSAGVISEAGLPAVADPGALVVEAAHRFSLKVVPLVGPSSLMMALMASGLNGQSFAFNGYLPIKEPERSRAIKRFESRAKSEGQSQIFIETPYRNVKLFDQFITSLAPETKLTVGVDITSESEMIRTLRVKEWRSAAKPDMHKRPTIFILG